MVATTIHEPFDMPDQGVKVCFVDTPGPLTGSGQSESGGTQIELVEPLPGNTSIAGFLEKNPAGGRSEEHTSELQSLMRISYAVFCLKNKKTYQKKHRQNKTQ